MRDSLDRDMIYIISQFEYIEQNEIDDLIRIFFDDEVIVIERKKLKRIIKAFQKLDSISS